MNLCMADTWKRRGVSLLWSVPALQTIAAPSDVVSIRAFFRIADAWPEELPAGGGNALVVAGLEGCIDVLDDADAESWLERDIHGAIVAFQQEYQDSGALIFWLPSGRKRIRMEPATEEYFWRRNATAEDGGLPIGRLLWSGAERDAQRIIISSESHSDIEGEDFVGIFQRRLS